MATPQFHSASDERESFAVGHKFAPDAPRPQWFSSLAEAHEFQNKTLLSPTIDEEITSEIIISDLSELSTENKFPIWIVEQINATVAAGGNFQLPITIPFARRQRVSVKSGWHTGSGKWMWVGGPEIKKWFEIEREDGIASEGTGAFLGIEAIPRNYQDGEANKEHWKFPLEIQWLDQQGGEAHLGELFPDYYPIAAVVRKKRKRVRKEFTVEIDRLFARCDAAEAGDKAAVDPRPSYDLGGDWPLSDILRAASAGRGHAFIGRYIKSLDHQLREIAVDLEKAILPYRWSARAKASFFTSWKVWQYFVDWAPRILREMGRKDDPAEAVENIHRQLWKYAQGLKSHIPDSAVDANPPPSPPSAEGKAKPEPAAAVYVVAENAGMPDLTELQRVVDRANLHRELTRLNGQNCRYPKELYHADGRCRVVHGPEEHASLNIEGWADEKSPGKEYRVHTAVESAAAMASEGQSQSEPAVPLPTDRSPETQGAGEPPKFVADERTLGAPPDGDRRSHPGTVIDEGHRYHVNILRQVLGKLGKWDIWLAENRSISRTAATDYMAGRIKGKISPTKRDEIEAAIIASAERLGLATRTNSD